MVSKQNLSEGVKAVLQLDAATGRCSNPDCEAALIEYRNGIPIKNFEFAHIRDERPPSKQTTNGIGWRYYPAEDMSQEERNQANNILLLCPPCHKLIDKIRPKEFPVDLLLSWKSSSEKYYDFKALGFEKFSDQQRFENSLSELVETQKKILRKIGIYRFEDFEFQENIEISKIVFEMLLSEETRTLEAIAHIVSKDDGVAKATSILKQSISNTERIQEEALNSTLKSLKEIAALNYIRNSDESVEALTKVIEYRPHDVEALQMLGILENRMGNVQKAKTLFDTILRIAQERKDDLLIAITSGDLAVLARQSGDLKLSEKLSLRALKTFKRQGVLDGIVIQLIALGTIQQLKANYPAAKSYYNQALEYIKKTELKSELSTVYCHLGNLSQVQGDIEKSIALYAKALDISKGDDDIEGMTMALVNLASSYNLVGNYSEAMTKYQEALRHFEQIKSLDGIASVLGNMGYIHFRHGNIDTAEQLFLRSLFLFEKIGKKLGAGNQLGNLALVCIANDKLDFAEECLNRALTIFVELDIKPSIAIQYSNLANVELKRGNHSNALDLNRKSLAIDLEFGIIEGAAITYGKMGDIYFALEKYDKAETEYKKSLKANKKLGRQHGIATQHYNLGRLALVLAKSSGGEYHLKKALEIFSDLGNISMVRAVSDLINKSNET